MTDPELDRFFDRLVNGHVSRRELLQRFGAAGLTLGGGSLLAACGGVEGTQESAQTQTQKVASVNHPKTDFSRLNFTNWPLYIDKEVLKDFEQQYGAQVKYTEEINDNEEFYGKVRAQLERGQDIERDLVVLTDWMAARWIRNGFTEPIDKDNVPNVRRNLIDTLKSPPFDPQRNHTVPWQSGMTAIGYDIKKTGGEIKSIEALFDPKYKGRVTFLDDPRDSANLVMLMQGKKPAEATIDDVLAAIERVEQANSSGQIRRFTGNDYTTDLTKGNVWVAMAWSGDIIQLQADNPNLRFAIPEQGANIWSDNMMMPKGVQHPYAAETMMNYAYDPEVAAKIAAYVNYVTPVKGAKEVLAKTDPDLAEDQLIFPDAGTLAKLHPYPNLKPAEERQMNEAWQRVVGG